MPIDFSPERWRQVKDNARRWWAGELDRPLIHLTVGGRDPGRPLPRLLNGVSRADFYNPTISPEDIVDRWDYDLSCREYLGDAFPTVWPDLGPGVLATALGGVATPRPDTVWFHPPREMEIGDVHFRYDASARWMQRIKAICRTAMDRWQGQVQIGMTDLGGNLDVVSTFRPGEQLLLDLYDRPDEVKRLAWETHEAWWQAFRDLDATLRPLNPGYTGWAPIFSESPYYMLQCDFCYMIGPEMFDEFVKPELVATCRRLINPFYHLDGIGQLPHLDSLLRIPELKGVQWVPGTGQKPLSQWPEVYRRIRTAGKLVQMWDAPPYGELDTIARAVGDARGMVVFAGASRERREQALDYLKRYGAA
jgi:5-methyltetrahydrofolate--homocysteine methyltransferase